MVPVIANGLMNGKAMTNNEPNAELFPTHRLRLFRAVHKNCGRIVGFSDHEIRSTSSKGSRRSSIFFANT
jgi:hypothetical protein